MISVQRKQLCSAIKQTPKGICFSNVLWLLHMKISLASLQGGSDGSGSTRHAEGKQYRNRGYSCQTQGQAKVSSRAKPTSHCLLQVTFSLAASATIPEVGGKTDQSQSQKRAQELSLTANAPLGYNISKSSLDPRQLEVNSFIQSQCCSPFFSF